MLIVFSGVAFHFEKQRILVRGGLLDNPESGA
jgi:hypothetical protein